MDTTRPYVEKCMQSEEIQKQKPENPQGEYIYTPDDGFADQFCGDDPSLTYVWLPRQDELQAMIGDFSDCDDVLDRYYNAERHDFMGWDTKADSMEQLWLALVMREKWGKVWNGKEWREVELEWN